ARRAAARAVGRPALEAAQRLGNGVSQKQKNFRGVMHGPPRTLRGFRPAHVLLSIRPSLGRDSQGRGPSVKRLSLLLSFALLGGAVPAAALPLTLTLVPSSTTLAKGQSFTVAVVVGGLTEFNGDTFSEIALESFDLHLQFDTSRLQYTGLAFGGSLGDPTDGS